MKSRRTLLLLATLTAPLSAQVLIQPSVTIEGPDGEVIVTEGEMPPGLVLPPGAVVPGGAGGGGAMGDLDFNRLRQLIEQSKNRPAPTPAQQKQAILRELNFDRSTSGILATRLEEARANAAPAEAPPAPPVAPPEAPPVPVPVPEPVPELSSSGLSLSSSPG